MSYQRRASPLHATRAGVAAVWCLVLGVMAIGYESAIVLLALLGAVLAAGALAGVGPQVRRAALWGIPFALAIALVNALVSRDGATLLLTSDPLPVIGPLDITLEAVTYGLILGLRALVVLVAAGALLAAAVDPDELLRGLRRVSVHSGVTAALATRLVPVLARDARRLSDARRALGAGTPTGAERVAVLRAVTAGALDRATDVAATLEVRGFATGRRPPRLARPWSRHDLAFAASAIGLCLLAVAGGPPGLLAAAAVACALAPFLDRRGIER
jgi:energy-coupling factor transport system permease protein